MTGAADAMAGKDFAKDTLHQGNKGNFVGRRRAFFAVFLLGLISALAFEPVGLWPLMPLAFAGLACVLSKAKGLRDALFIGWLFGLGQFVLGLNWIATAFTFQAAMPAWYGWVAVVLLSFYLAVYPALATGLAWRFGQRSFLALVMALAGGWAITEYLRATMFTGFAWNPVGVSLVDTPWLQISKLVGTYGLSPLVVAIGGWLWLIARRTPRAGWGLVPLALALLPGIPPRMTEVATGRTIRVVQPNIGQELKWRPGLDEEAFARLSDLSLHGPQQPKIIFWPEVAVPVAFQVAGPGANPPLPLPPVRRAAGLLRSDDILVTGAMAVIADERGNVLGSTNSVMPIDASGRILGRYDKAHLVPYGEYLPMRPLLTALGLSALAPGIGDTLPGPGPHNLNLPGWGRMGLQICYEIIFSGQVVDPVNRPAFLFNPSNDAWFGRWGPPQHLAQARLRAAEEGLPVIRSTPTGISAVIAPSGRLMNALPWRTAGVIDTEMPLPAAATPFSRHGNVIPLTLAFLLLILAVGTDARARYRTHI